MTLADPAAPHTWGVPARIVYIVVLLIALLQVSCAHVHVFDPANPRGRDVEAMIDSGLIPFVNTAFPTFKVTQSKCPDHIDVSAGKVGHCTLEVAGVPLPVRVWHDESSGQLKANFDGSLYSRSIDERFVESHLARSYGVSATAHCNEAIVTARRAGQRIHCRVSGSDKPFTVELEVSDNGGGFAMFVPRWLTLPRAESDALQRHRAGGRVLLKRRTLEKIINDFVAGEERAPGVHLRIQPVRCPASADLTGGKHVRCIVPIGGNAVRYEVSIDDKAGFQVNVLDAVIRTQALVTYAEQTLNQQLVASGEIGDAKVYCGKQAAIVKPAHSTFTCEVQSGGKVGHLQIVVQDANGVVQLGSVEMNQ